ncbi:hypothetical protein JCM30566_18300 [Marinitoga arctica]
MPEEKKNEQEELDLSDLLDDAEKINKLMDLDDVENSEKTDLEELEDKKIDDKISDLKDLELSEEVSDEEIVPEVEDVEKMVEEFEKKFSQNSDKKEETEEIPELEVEETKEETEEIPELEIEETKEETEEIPELEIEETKEETEIKNLQHNLSQKIEEEIIMPNIKIEDTELEDKLTLFEEKINKKFEEYEKKIEELRMMNKLLKKRLKLYDLKVENIEETLVIVLKNLILSTPGDTNSLLNAIIEIKPFISSKKNILNLINIVESLKTKLSEQNEYVLNYILGNLNFEIGNWSEAEKSYLRALHFCEKDKNLDMQFNTSVIQNNLGTMYAEKGKRDLARGYFEASLEIRKKLKEKSEKYSIYLYYSLNNLGSLEMNSGNLDKAEEYFNEAYKILQMGNISDEDQAMLLLNMGNLYMEKVQEKQAIEFLKKAFEIYLKLYEEKPLKFGKNLKKTSELLSKYDESILQKYGELFDELNFLE